MKIAFIDVTTTVLVGGVQTAVWQLSAALAEMGHEVTVYGGQGEVRPHLHGCAVDVCTFPFTPRKKFPNFGVRFRKLAERLSFARHARHAVAAADYDWVILTKPFDFFWPRLLGTSNTRFAFMSGGTDFFLGDRWLAKAIDVFMACSHFNAWQNGVHFKRFPSVIYNGVDVQHFQPGLRNWERRRALGVKDHELLFAFAGRIVGWKGLAVALRALAEPALKNLPLRLMIIGEGDAKSGLQKLAAQLGIEEQLIFQGAVPHEELPVWYGLADVGIFPSIADEAFGITIAEAMACALPVIGSHIGGIPEVIGNEGSSGVLVPAADHRALATAMAHLAENGELRQLLGQQARQRIKKHFTWQQSAFRLLENLQP
jgi:glycosyltransferase involved in cell wall biosynthesis